MSDKQRDLKPCPMCGGPAIFEINDSTDTRYGLDSVRVECAGCGVQTEHEFSDNPFNKDDCEKARDRAAEAWNNRAAQSAGEETQLLSDIKELPPGFKPLAHNHNTGEWLYLNHASTWQLCPPPQLPQSAGEVERDQLAARVGWLEEALSAVIQLHQ